MDYKDLISDVKARKFKPLYLLHGEESYYIDKVAEYMEENILTPEQKDFNFHVFYGKDAQPQQIMDACQRFPMFSDLNLIIVREAQMMKAKGTGNEEIDGEIVQKTVSGLELLEPYTANPARTSILVICYKDGKYDARKKVFRHFKEKGIVFESKPLKENELPVFIEAWLKRKKVAAEGKAINILIEYLGNDLSKITNELEKLCINLREGEKITPELIEKNIGISKDYNVYELQSALLTKNSTKAFTIVDYLNDNAKANPFVLTIANIFAAFQKLYHFQTGGDFSNNDLWPTYQIHYTQANEYRIAKSLYAPQQVEKIFEIILEFDLRSKGVYNDNTSHAELLKELVYRIMN